MTFTTSIRHRARLPAFFALVVSIFLSGACVFAQEQVELKPDVPKLDTRSQPPSPPGPDAKPRSPLQGKVERQDKYSNSLGGYASGGQPGGWGKGRADITRKMRAGAKNNSMGAQVESGIGIIGVKFVMFIGRPPVINRVFPATPAAQMGLQVNDMIVAVDGVPTFGLTKEEVYDMIVGAPGSPVTLSIKRAGDYIAVTMTRMDLNDLTDPFVRRDYMMNM
jgi:hypothetical protein